MATRITSASPRTATSTTPAANSQTGNWRHPRFDEINRRLNGSTFGEKNIKQILWRMAGLVVLFIAYEVNEFLSWQLHFNVLHFIYSLLPHSLSFFLDPILPLSLFAYALLPLRPLLKNHDDLSDIPLTPKQRALLGLRPASQPATPGSQYITPPRYSRSATPRSSSTSRSDSPFSGRGSPLGGGVSPSSYSPLYQKALGRDTSRRLSLGSPSPLNLGRNMSEGTNPAGNMSSATLLGKGANVGLNNRWLYERGRRSSSGLRLYA